MIGSADSDKSSSGRKLLFHEAIGLDKKRLPMMEKKEKPTTEFSVPQLQKVINANYYFIHFLV